MKRIFQQKHDPENGQHGDCHRCCIAMILCKLVYLIYRNAEMIQPFSCDFFTCTFFHRLLGTFTNFVREA